MNGRFMPAHGGYQNLLAFQKAGIVYDATVRFCADHLAKRDRTVDQMIQAARSGKQNIVEASMASGTSKETEIKLTNVARASLEELLTDYRDFLRTRGLREWNKNSPEALYVRRLSAGKIAPPASQAGKGTKAGKGRDGTDGTDGTKGADGTDGTNATNGTNAPPHRSPGSHPSHLSHSSHSPSPSPSPSPVTFEAFRHFFATRPPETLANIVICLIHQTNYLLDRQLARLEKDFVEQGGLRERMTRARLRERDKQRGRMP